MRARIAAPLLLAACITELPEVAEPCGTWPEPGLYDLTIDMPDKKRKALVEIGPSTGPRDLVVAIHGGSQNAKDFLTVTRFSSLLDSGEEPLVVVYPQGRKTLFWRMWNAGPCCGSIDDDHRDALDVEFLDALVKELQAKTCVDRSLAAGFSNGGMMAMRWGCESDVPDAVLTAAGPLLTDRCEGQPKPMRAYHGTADDTVPIEGGDSPLGNNVWPPAEKGWAMWRERNECVDVAAESFDFGPMTCVRYAECAAPTEVCTIEGFGHAWPGGRNIGGLESNATLEAIDFLRASVPRDRDRKTSSEGSVDAATSEPTADTGTP
jgi:polyhydroxybutyrate depolymerase